VFGPSHKAPAQPPRPYHPDHLDQFGEDLFRGFGGDIKVITVLAARGFLRRLALIDEVSIDDDLRGLAILEYLYCYKTLSIRERVA
jgi:hypothetical protein